MQYCPHCSGKLSLWRTPMDSSWGGAEHLVCFNDECPYFRKGWKHMMDKYEVPASYRFRHDPDTGANGPLPVWSPDALRNFIVDEGEEGNDAP